MPAAGTFFTPQPFFRIGGMPDKFQTDVPLSAGYRPNLPISFCTSLLVKNMIRNKTVAIADA